MQSHRQNISVYYITLFLQLFALGFACLFLSQTLPRWEAIAMFLVAPLLSIAIVTISFLKRAANDNTQFLVICNISSIIFLALLAMRYNGYAVSVAGLYFGVICLYLTTAETMNLLYFHHKKNGN